MISTNVFCMGSSMAIISCIYFSLAGEFMSTETRTSKKRARCSWEQFLAIYTTSISLILSVFSFTTSMKPFILDSIFFKLPTFAIHFPLFTSNSPRDSEMVLEWMSMCAKGSPSLKCSSLRQSYAWFSGNLSANLSMAWQISALRIITIINQYMRTPLSQHIIHNGKSISWNAKEGGQQARQSSIGKCPFVNYVLAQQIQVKENQIMIDNRFYEQKMFSKIPTTINQNEFLFQLECLHPPSSSIIFSRGLPQQLHGIREVKPTRVYESGRRKTTH